MYNSSFQLNKTRRAINTFGNTFEFIRHAKNAYEEPTDEILCAVSIKGVYHEKTGYLSSSAIESTTVRERSYPMILCLWEKQAELIMIDDLVSINSKIYKVQEIKDIAEAHIVADISLEEVQT